MHLGIGGLGRITMDLMRIPLEFGNSVSECIVTSLRLDGLPGVRGFNFYQTRNPGSL